MPSNTVANANHAIGSFKVSGKPLDFETRLDFKTRLDGKPLQSRLDFETRLDLKTRLDHHTIESRFSERNVSRFLRIETRLV